VELLRRHLCSDNVAATSASAGVRKTNTNYIYCSSDCEDVAQHMREQFTAAGFTLLRSAEEYAECVSCGMFVHPAGAAAGEGDGAPAINPELWKTVCTHDHWLRFNPLVRACCAMVSLNYCVFTVHLLVVWWCVGRAVGAGAGLRGGLAACVEVRVCVQVSGSGLLLAPRPFRQRNETTLSDKERAL
jgi:hypothetical protein